MIDETNDAKFRIEIPEQGLDERFNAQELEAFFVREGEFWARHSTLLSQPLTIQQHNHPVNDVLERGREWIAKVLSGIRKGNFEGFELYQSTARDMEVVIGQGRFGRSIDTLVAKRRENEARSLFAILSGPSPHSSLNAAIAPYRTIFRNSPGTLFAQDLKSTESMLNSAKIAEAATQTAKEQLQAFIGERTAIIDDLAQLYREKLTLEAPATLWGKEAENQTTRWRLSLFVFMVSALAPIMGFAVWNDQIVALIVKLTTTSSNGISVAGIAAITVPALFYAWLLKNVSRVFQQSLALADDANHRRALTLTYLGLAENPKLVVKDADRALILNALFRGTPNVSTDDGPPAGLLDLIASKTKPSS